MITLKEQVTWAIVASVSVFSIGKLCRRAERQLLFWEPTLFNSQLSKKKEAVLKTTKLILTALVLSIAISSAILRKLKPIPVN